MKNESIIDHFESIKLKWKFCDPEKTIQRERFYYELSFNNEFRETVLNSYLPYVLKTSDAMKEREKVVKLFMASNCGCGWDPIELGHRMTFEKLAMDPELKHTIKGDIERFVKIKEFYKRVGKARKHGYLLFGPPGTGKSSLIAAMANYLKFDIFDLELTNVHGNMDLKRTLLSVAVANRSILVIEDIDCSLQIKDRRGSRCGDSDSKLTLSGILNMIDGLWSSCGDERIIVFTTNHKEHLDLALLRPGRMDTHFHMSYLQHFPRLQDLGFQLY